MRRRMNVDYKWRGGGGWMLIISEEKDDDDDYKWEGGILMFIINEDWRCWLWIRKEDKYNYKLTW